MKLIKLSSLLCLLLLSTTAFGQTKMSVEGTVYDSTGVKALPNAVAMAVRIKDSLLLGSARTDKDGKFRLEGFAVDTFSLIIDHPLYDDKVFFMFGSEENNEIKIPSILMPTKSQELDEVIIYANKEAVFYRGDTLVYVADSFKVHDNAVVEDLLRKLPGIEVDENGKIKSQGQDINKVLVDGDEFFGADPTIATKNLGAKGVESVQVYETENEERKDGEDEKIQVLDLKLKDAYKSGYFGRISGATDISATSLSNGNNFRLGDSFYEGEVLFNKFNGSQKFSVFALSSNTPRSNFGWNDIRQFGLDNETSNGNRWDQGSAANTSGIPQTMRAGIYYSDKFGKKKKAKLNFNYSFYNEKLDAISDSRSQYFLADTVYSTEDYSRQINESQSHRVNLDFKAPLDSMTTIRIKPSIRLDYALNEQLDSTSFIGSDEVTSLRTVTNNNYDANAYEINTLASIERKFKKKGREVELTYKFNKDNSETDGKLLATSAFLSSPVPYVDSVDQRKINYSNSRRHDMELRYREPLSKTWRIEPEYRYENGFSSQDRSTFDRAGESYTALNDSFSNIFDTYSQQHWIGTKLVYENSKHMMSFRALVRDIEIKNNNRITDAVIYQDFTNFLPTFDYQFRPAKNKRFGVKYRTASDQPSINDLQPVPDNSNPNSIRIGNPDLKPNYAHNVELSFNSWEVFSGRFIWSRASLSVIDNAFANSTSYDIYGRSISQTVNVDGNIFGNVFAGASFPLYKRVISLRPNVISMYNKYTNLINNEANETKTLTAGGGLRLNFEWDSLRFEIYNNYNYNSSQSSLNRISSEPYTTQNYGFTFRWTMPKGFVLSTDGRYTINEQPGEGFFDIKYFVWNAEFSKSFLKTQNLMVSLVGNDILNQNINAARRITANVVTDNRTTIISRYFLLKATLRFNNNKTQQKDYEGWH
ncbi:MAG: hypothetical protein EP338_12295 [Bacteroidetes bacterium]|nr:MAG: hypothetical protein EP338_12295 [Bacteroidota bacterium]